MSSIVFRKAVQKCEFDHICSYTFLDTQTPQYPGYCYWCTAVEILQSFFPALYEPAALCIDRKGWSEGRIRWWCGYPVVPFGSCSLPSWSDCRAPEPSCAVRWWRKLGGWPPPAYPMHLERTNQAITIKARCFFFLMQWFISVSLCLKNNWTLSNITQTYTPPSCHNITIQFLSCLGARIKINDYRHEVCSVFIPISMYILLYFVKDSLRTWAMFA